MPYVRRSARRGGDGDATRCTCVRHATRRCAQAWWWWILRAVVFSCRCSSACPSPGCGGPAARPWTTVLLVVLGGAAVVSVVVEPWWRSRVHRWEVTDEAVYAPHRLVGAEWRSSRRSLASRPSTPCAGRWNRRSACPRCGSPLHRRAGAIEIVGLDHEVAARTAERLTAITQRTPGDAYARVPEPGRACPGCRSTPDSAVPRDVGPGPPLAVGDRRHLDSRMIAVDAVQAVVSLVPVVVLDVVVGASNEGPGRWPLVAVAVGGVFGAAADAYRWLVTRYRITGELVELRTGLLVRRERPCDATASAASMCTPGCDTGSGACGSSASERVSRSRPARRPSTSTWCRSPTPSGSARSCSRVAAPRRRRRPSVRGPRRSTSCRTTSCTSTTLTSTCHSMTCHSMSCRPSRST